MTRADKRAVKAWHFLADDGKLRDGRRAPRNGVWLKHMGPAVMCESGLHASLRVTDALQYAPGSLVCRVECRNIVAEQDDKLLCIERRIIWRLDATDVLRAFARKCALDVLHLWDAPDIVVRYLKTGDESIRAAAWTAAWAAAWPAARAAARAAAWAAAWPAAGDAAWDAARAAAWPAAGDAAWDAARAAAWTAAWTAAGDAAWDAAGDAARAAARTKQERRLAAMLNAARAK